MSENQTGVVFRQLALVLFPDSSDFGCCLKSELENPKPSADYSKRLKSEHVRISDSPLLFGTKLL